jgi:hypothetical protein
MICDYLAATVTGPVTDDRSIIWVVPFLSLLRLLRCGEDDVSPSTLSVMNQLLKYLRPEQLSALKDRNAWHLLVPLLHHSNTDVNEWTSRVMYALAGLCSGGDYAEFLENNFFEEAITRIRPPALITLEVPIATEADSPSTNFTALGTTWFCVFCFFFWFLVRGQISAVNHCHLRSGMLP